MAGGDDEAAGLDRLWKARDVIEALAAAMLKPTFTLLMFAWGSVVLQHDTLGSLTSLAVVGLMFYVIVVRSVRLRGKRAEGGP